MQGRDVRIGQIYALARVESDHAGLQAEDRHMKKILLIEDNELNRDMLSRRLQKRGYEVVAAVDGETGIAAAQTEAPALILMDVSLPGIDGWEATRRLKALAETRHVPIVALTAYALPSDREKALAVGCDDFDTKPIDLPRLLGKIEALLSPGQRV
jgi:CheY-like chemotaxis protein